MTVKTNATGTNPGAGAERVAIEQPAGEDADVSKALAHVGSIVSSIENIVKGMATAPAAAASGEEEGGGEEEVEKGAVTLKTLLSKAGLSGDVMKTALESLTKAGFDPNAKFGGQESPEKPKKTTKAAAEVSEGVAEVVSNDTPLTLEDIIKAKQFTPARIEKLKQAYDILKMVIESVAQGTMPKTNTPALSTAPAAGITAEGAGGSVVIKNNDLAEAVSKALKPVVDKVTELGNEVAAIKNARPASNSVSEEGGTETKTKKNGSLWSGIL